MILVVDHARTIERAFIEANRDGGKRPCNQYNVFRILSESRDPPIGDQHHLQPISST